MVATPLVEAEVQALYPSSAAQNQRDKRLADQIGAEKDIRREIGPNKVARTKRR